MHRYVAAMEFLSATRSEFTTKEFAQKLEVSTKNARAMLRTLEDCLYVKCRRRAPLEPRGRGGRSLFWQSCVKVSRR